MIYVTGDVSVQARNTDGTDHRTIDALVAAVAVGIAGSAGGGSTGASVSASIALNRIAGNVRAYIGSQGAALTGNTMTANGISRGAKDQTQILADTVAASVTASLAGGGDSVAVSIALSYAENLIENTVTAEIVNTDVTASGAVTVDADQVSRIRAFGLAASISVSASAAAMRLVFPVAVSWFAT